MSYGYTSTAPSSTIGVTAYLTPEACRIFVDACEKLKALGIEPTLNLCVLPDPGIAAIKAQAGVVCDR